MKTYQLLWHMIRYRPLLYSISVFNGTLFFLSRVVFGFVIQTFFNVLPTDKHLGFSIWSLIAFLVATAIVRAMIMFGGERANILYFFTVRALLRRNLLERILDRPGAQGLPESPGDIVSRFRDDIQLISDTLS